MGFQHSFHYIQPFLVKNSSFVNFLPTWFFFHVFSVFFHVIVTFSYLFPLGTPALLASWLRTPWLIGAARSLRLPGHPMPTIMDPYGPLPATTHQHTLRIIRPYYDHITVNIWIMSIMSYSCHINPFWADLLEFTLASTVCYDWLNWKPQAFSLFDIIIDA